MEIWEERVHASGVRDKAREVREQVDLGGGSSEEEQIHLDRLGRIADLVGWRSANVDPALIASSVLTRLAEDLDQLIHLLERWRAGEGSELLTTHSLLTCDRLLESLASIPVPPTAPEAIVEIGSLRRSVGQHRGQVERELEGVLSALTDAHTAFDARCNEAEQAVAGLKAEVSAATAEVAAAVVTGRDLANQQQNAFAAAQTERQESFARLLADLRAEHGAALSELEERVTAETASAQLALAEDLEASAAARSRVEQILDIVAETALIGSYSKTAGEERDAANIWRWIAVLAVVATVMIGAWLVQSARGDGTDWDLLIAKLAVALPVAGVAAYAARQSSEHRHAQREAQHVALQLAALKPYLNDLEKTEDRDELLGEIGRRLFGQPRRDGRRDERLASLMAENPSILGQMIPLLQQGPKGR